MRPIRRDSTSISWLGRPETPFILPREVNKSAPGPAVSVSGIQPDTSVWWWTSKDEWIGRTATGNARRRERTTPVGLLQPDAARDTADRQGYSNPAGEARREEAPLSTTRSMALRQLFCVQKYWIFTRGGELQTPGNLQHTQDTHKNCTDQFLSTGRAVSEHCSRSAATWGAPGWQQKARAF